MSAEKLPVTSEMIAAGEEILAYAGQGVPADQLVTAIYRAMATRAPSRRHGKFQQRLLREAFKPAS